MKTKSKFKRNTGTNKKRHSVWRTVAVVVIETLFMATAWTVCALAPMPWNIVVPITIGIRGIIVKAILQAKSNGGKKQ